MEQAYSLGVSAPVSKNMANSSPPVRRLLDCFFVGFGLAFAVHFIVLPITSRDLVTLVLNEYLHVLKGAIDAEAALLASLPGRDWSHATGASNLETDSAEEIPLERRTPWPEADKWRTVTTAATECQIKLQSELRYVKREVTFGKLSGKDYASVVKLLKNIFVPIAGVETVIQVNDRVENRGGWTSVRTLKDSSGTELSDQSSSDVERENWTWLFSQIDPTLNPLWQAMIEGLDYAFYTLQITKKPIFSTKVELEARAAESPDGRGFAQYLEKTINHFLIAREAPLKECCRLNGLDETQASDKSSHQRNTSQLYLLLDVSHLELFLKPP